MNIQYKRHNFNIQKTVLDNRVIDLEYQKTTSGRIYFTSNTGPVFTANTFYSFFLLVFHFMFFISTGKYEF